MFSYLGKLAAVAAFIIPTVIGAPAHHLKLRNPTAIDVVPDSYIVVYNTDVSAESIASHIESVSSLIARRDVTVANAGIGATYNLDQFKGYHIVADSATIASIAAAAEVSQLISNPCLQS